MTDPSSRAVREVLYDAGLLGADQQPALTALTGGVSSDIWKVEVGANHYCVKQALDRLKVAAEWHAPVERNQFEVRWYQAANRLVPGSAPRILHQDGTRMAFVMAYLDPRDHELWKEKLREGRAEPRDAAQVGRDLAAIHAGAAGDPAIAEQFPRRDIFHDIRLEPYLLATAAKHPDLQARIEALARSTAATRLTMIHGDVSPKNILIGPRGPVFLDAECACIGDPAFDVAFCLNHMLLKCLWNPPATDAYLACFDALSEGYRNGVDWEDPAALDARAAALLPALFLARVDGKSPVEYLTDERDHERIRRCARHWLVNPSLRLQDIRVAWTGELAQ